MADKSSELERIYTVPLRRAKYGTRSKRANRAIGDVRMFMQRHMKSENVWIDTEVNEALWSRGKFKIPSKIRVRATRFSDGVVEVTLPTADEGSAREVLAERREKAAENPVLTPMGMDDEEETSPGGAEPVTAITGIGPAMAEKLGKIEIETVGDLAASNVAAVSEATSRSKDEATAWIEQARELAETTVDDSEE